MMESDLKSDKMDLLSTSMQESGLFSDQTEVRTFNIWRLSDHVQQYVTPFSNFVADTSIAFSRTGRLAEIRRRDGDG